MFADERRQAILAEVRRSGAVSIKDLARLLDATEVTVRRDLVRLDAQGLLDRRHGGAVTPGSLTREPTHRQKAIEAAAEKAAIGALAATLVRPGDAVAIGPGTTTAALARALVGVADLTVVTSSLLVATALAEAPGVEVVLTGGTVRGAVLALVGSDAERSLEGVRTDRVLLSGNGLTAARGLSTPTVVVAGVDRALVATAGEVVVLADSSKVGRETMVRTVPATAIDVLVTDPGADADELAGLADAGVDVRVAGPAPDAIGVGQGVEN